MPDRDIAAGAEDTITGETDVAAPWAISGAATVVGEANIVAESYLLDNQRSPTLVSETRTPQTLSLTLRVSEATRANVLAPLRSAAGKLDTLVAADGSFRTLDRSQSGNTLTVTPPSARQPPRTKREYLVAGYSERPLDQGSGSHEVTLDLRAASNREPDAQAVDETRASDEWALDTRAGQIATHRVATDRESGMDTSAETESLTLILTPGQTATLEAAASRIGAVAVREVPDGPNSYDDNSTSPTNANTITLTTPDGTSPMSGGDYVVVEWSTEWLSAAAYRVQLTLGQP